jgi:predicted ArsR family transcriptional regulator
MRERILQMVRENRRTAKELADVLGLSKQEVISHLSALPVSAVKTIMHNGRVRPVVVVQYFAK